jgi:hypothetical protein
MSVMFSTETYSSGQPQCLKAYVRGYRKKEVRGSRKGLKRVKSSVSDSDILNLDPAF